MSSAVPFLVVAVAAAILGSLLLWLWHRVRRTEPPTFHEHLAAIAPREHRSGVVQPPGIIALDPDTGEEVDSGTRPSN